MGEVANFCEGFVTVQRLECKGADSKRRNIPAASAKLWSARLESSSRFDEIRQSAPEQLGKSELALLRLINLGMTNREIAKELAVEVPTIKWRIRQIFQKLGARNRIEALARARQGAAAISGHNEPQAIGPMPEPLRKIELDILRLLDLGMTNQEIASDLAMTAGTIGWRMSQIFGKLQARNRIEALVRVRHLGLL